MTQLYSKEVTRCDILLTASERWHLLILCRYLARVFEWRGVLGCNQTSIQASCEVSVLQVQRVRNGTHLWLQLRQRHAFQAQQSQSCGVLTLSRLYSNQGFY